MKKVLYTSVIILMSVCTIPLIANTPAYTITDLGTLGGTRSSANSINDKGYVVGTSMIAGSSYSHAFMYDGTTMHDLTASGAKTSEAYDINDNDQIVGLFSPSSYSDTVAFSWENSTVNILPGEAYASAVSVNNNGQIAGFTGRPDVDGIYACYWENSVKFDLSTLFPETSRAIGINNLGQIIGYSFGYQKGFLWDPTNGLSYLGSSIYPQAINDNGQIVFRGGQDREAYLYQQGITISLNIKNNLHYEAVPRSINNNTQIVGVIDPSYTPKPFLWEKGRCFYLEDLIETGSESWTLQNAFDINNSGQIVGTGVINGEQHGFLMTPVPEPATVVLLAVGGVALVRKRRLSVTSQQ